MMAATHALIGLLLAITAGSFSTGMTLYAAAAAFTGGLFPDLDLLFEHRKTLHYPVGYTVAALLTGLYVLVQPSIVSISIFYFFFSAAVHSVIDIFGGGLETRPWIPSSDRAVYSNTLAKWFSPRRWIRYDGSPEDLLFSGFLAVPCYFYYSSPIKELVIITLLAGAVYTLLRKKIVEWVPDRFL